MRMRKATSARVGDEDGEDVVGVLDGTALGVLVVGIPVKYVGLGVNASAKIHISRVFSALEFERTAVSRYGDVRA